MVFRPQQNRHLVYPQVDAVCKPIQVVLEHSVPSHCAGFLITCLNTMWRVQNWGKSKHPWQIFSAFKGLQCRQRRQCRQCRLYILSVPNLSSPFELAANSRSDIERDDDWKPLRDHCHATGSHWDQSTARYQLNRSSNQEAKENEVEVGGVHTRKRRLLCYSTWLRRIERQWWKDQAGLQVVAALQRWTAVTADKRNWTPEKWVKKKLGPGCRWIPVNGVLLHSLTACLQLWTNRSNGHRNLILEFPKLQTRILCLCEHDFTGSVMLRDNKRG